MKQIFLFLFSLLFSVVLPAQNKAMRAGDDFANKLSYPSAIKAYEHVLAKDSLNQEALHKIADCHYLIGNWKNANTYYSQLNNLGALTVNEKYNYAQTLKVTGDNDDANRMMIQFAAQAPNDSRAKAYLKATETGLKFKEIKSNTIIRSAKINTRESELCALRKNGVTYYTASGNHKHAIKRIHDFNNKAFLDIYATKDSLLNGQENAIETALLHSLVNTKFHDGPACMSAKGDLIYYTQNSFTNNKLGKDSKGITQLKIYACALADYLEPIELPFNSEEYSCGHPSASADGKWLYFTSNMPGTIGGTDIWRVSIQDNTYGTPENLGPTINTEGNEMFPFIHEDGTLYFASNGHLGIGGLDLFGSQFTGNKFLSPVNLGTKFNTAWDDFAFTANKAYSLGYFTSNHPHNNGEDWSDDIYVLEMDGPLFEKKNVQGIIKDDSDGKPLANVVVTLKDEQGNSLGEYTTDDKGNYSFPISSESNYTLSLVCPEYQSKEIRFSDSEVDGSNRVVKDASLLPDLITNQLIVNVRDAKTGELLLATVAFKSNDEKSAILNKGTDTSPEYSYDLKPTKLGQNYSYTIIVEKEGYLPMQTTLAGQWDKSRKAVANISLSKFLIGQDLGAMIDVKPIYFDKNSSDIREDAAIELNKIVEVMKLNPTLEIELGSHTDCRASKAYNQSLSQRRATSSKEYIVQKGIDAKRIKGKGYGESQLVNICECEENVPSPICPEEEHQANRRTVFTITKI